MLAGMVLAGSASAVTELVTNGGFETGDLTSWTVDSGTVTVSGSSAFHNLTITPQAGSWMAVLGSGNTVSGIVHEGFSDQGFVSGVLSFDYNLAAFRVSAGGSEPFVFQAINGTQAVPLQFPALVSQFNFLSDPTIDTDAVQTGWTHFTSSTLTLTKPWLTLKFGTDQASTTQDFVAYLDNVSFLANQSAQTGIPEPATAGLGLVGLWALSLLVVRRRKI
jgi:hypothetical protein